MEKPSWGANLEVLMIREGENFVAYCPALNLATQGGSFEEADRAFDEMIQIFMDEVMAMGTIDKVLEDAGWIKINQKWVPPTVINQTTKKIQIPA